MSAEPYYQDEACPADGDPMTEQFSNETLSVWAQKKFTDDTGSQLARQLLDARAEIRRLSARCAALEQAHAEYERALISALSTTSEEPE